MYESDKTITDLEEKLAKSNDTITSLKTQLKTAESKVYDSVKTITDLEKKLAKSNGTITELKTHLKTAENQQLLLESKVYESDKTITDLEEKLAKSNDTITSLKTQLTDAEETIRIREEALTLSSTNSEKSVGKINRLSNDNSRLNSVIAILDKKIQGLSDENQDNEELLESARSTIREADYQNKTLSLQLPSEVGMFDDSLPKDRRVIKHGGYDGDSDGEESDLESVEADFANASPVKTYGGNDGDSGGKDLNFDDSLSVVNQQKMDGSISTDVVNSTERKRIAWETPIISDLAIAEDLQKEFPALSSDGDIVPKKGHLIELGKDKMGAQQLMSDDDDSSSTPMNDEKGAQQLMSTYDDDSVDSSSTPTHEEMLEDAIRYDLEDKKKGRGKPKMKDGPSKSKKETALINKNEQRQSTPTNVDNSTEVRDPSPSYGEGRDKATITGVDNSVRHQNHQSGKNDSGKTGKWKDKKGKKKGGRGRLTGK